ncbi:transposase [Providencia stuartii]|nr:transposase [Providencia stuartii]
MKLCLDKGYDAGWLKTYQQNRFYEPNIQSRKEKSNASKNAGFKAHRWVVERMHSWMNRFHRILIRWDKEDRKLRGHVAFFLWSHCLE